MRTTVRLDNTLLERARREAVRRNETLTALIEQGLRLVLAQRRPRAAKAEIVLPECTAGGGTLPGVDLDDTASLLDILDGRK
jgi:hypothetical protein